MDELLNTEEKKVEPEFRLATISTVTSTGITLQFDGSAEGTDKEYKCNTSIRFSPGDRVKIIKESGSYIVECIVGAPMADYPIPEGGSTGQVLAKKTSQDRDVYWKTVNSYDGPSINGTGTSTLGFYGHTATTQTRVQKLNAYSTPTVNDLRDKVNEIIDALVALGLIRN